MEVPQVYMIVEQIVEQNRMDLLLDVGNDVLMDDRVVEYVARKSGQSSSDQPGDLIQIPTLEDKAVALKWVAANCNTLRLLGPNIQRDREVVLMAIQNSDGNMNLENLVLILGIGGFDLELQRAMGWHLPGLLEKLCCLPHQRDNPNSLGNSLLAGGARYQVGLTEYAKLLGRGPRHFTVVITPAEAASDVAQGFVQVKFTNLCGETVESYPQVQIDEGWTTTHGFRMWYALKTRDTVPDFAVVFGSSYGTPESEAALLNPLDPEWAEYAQHLQPAAAAVRRRGFQRGAGFKAANRIQRPPPAAAAPAAGENN